MKREDLIEHDKDEIADGATIYDYDLVHELLNDIESRIDCVVNNFYKISDISDLYLIEGFVDELKKIREDLF